MTAAAKIIPLSTELYCTEYPDWRQPAPRPAPCSFCGNYTDADDDARDTVRFDGVVERECGTCRIGFDLHNGKDRAT
jgi:hypothetical protein